MAEWTDGYWWSRDGLRLHFRDYAGPVEKPPILCLPTSLALPIGWQAGGV